MMPERQQPFARQAYLDSNLWYYHSVTVYIYSGTDILAMPNAYVHSDVDEAASGSCSWPDLVMDFGFCP